MLKLKKEIYNKENLRNYGFILPIIFITFAILEKFSIFNLIRKLFSPKKESHTKPFVKTPLFSDIWVTGNIFFAIGISLFVCHIQQNWILIICMLLIYQNIKIKQHNLKNDTKINPVQIT